MVLNEGHFECMFFVGLNHSLMANDKDDELKLASSHLIFIRNQLKQISLLSISRTTITAKYIQMHIKHTKIKGFSEHFRTSSTSNRAKYLLCFFSHSSYFIHNLLCSAFRSF